MKYTLSLIVLSISMASSAFCAEVTLSEAENMVDNGKAILVKLPKNVTMAELAKVQETNNTVVKDVNLTKPTTSPIIKEKLPETVVISEQVFPVAKEVVKKIEGVSIVMPTTLSSLLSKLSAMTGETYYCDDEINIPTSRIKIQSIEHLDKYLRQVTHFGIKITRDSNDPTIPKVLQVIRTDKGTQK